MMILHKLRHAIHFALNWRQHHRDDGSVKVSYPSWERASKIAQHMSRKTGQSIQPYRCKICQLYHVGNDPEVFQ